MSDCTGLADGAYRSCNNSGCAFFVTCSRLVLRITNKVNIFHFIRTLCVSTLVYVVTTNKEYGDNFGHFWESYLLLNKTFVTNKLGGRVICCMSCNRGHTKHPESEHGKSLIVSIIKEKMNTHDIHVCVCVFQWNAR